MVESQNASVDVALGSTVSTLSVSPSPAYVPFGGTIALTAPAKDANGALLLLAAGEGSEGVRWYTVSGRNTLKATSGSPTTTVTGIGVGGMYLYASLRTQDDGTTVTTEGTFVQTLPTTLAVGLQPEYVYGTTLSTFSTQSDANAGIFGPPVSSLVGFSANVSVSPSVAETIAPSASTTGPIHLANYDWSPGSVFNLYVPSGNTVGSAPGSVDHVDVDTPASVTATLGPLTSTATTIIKADPLASVSGAASVAVAPTVVSSGGMRGHSSATYTFRNSVSFAFTVPTVTTARTATITATRAGVSKTYPFTITP